MIVCHCNIIHCRDVRAVGQAHADGADGPVSAGRVFRALCTKPNCAGCVPLITKILAEARADRQPECAGCACPAELPLAAE